MSFLTHFWVNRRNLSSSLHARWYDKNNGQVRRRTDNFLRCRSHRCPRYTWMRGPSSHRDSPHCHIAACNRSNSARTMKSICWSHGNADFRAHRSLRMPNMIRTCLVFRWRIRVSCIVNGRDRNVTLENYVYNINCVRYVECVRPGGTHVIRIYT